jgi:uncharacterized protein YigA (DUF484 family)
MALTATLLAFASGLAAKVKTPPAKKEGEIERLFARIRSLECQLTDTENERDLLQAVLDRRRATEAQDARWAHATQYAALQNAQSAQMAQMAMQSQHQLTQYSGLLGAQNLQLPGWACTCIPDRASVLRRG